MEGLFAEIDALGASVEATRSSGDWGAAHEWDAAEWPQHLVDGTWDMLAAVVRDDCFRGDG